MSTVNNGNFKRSTLTITKTVNGEVPSGWPKAYNIMNAFGAYPLLTQEQFALMDQAAYSARLTAFLAHVDNDNPEFILSDISVSGLSNGTDLVACPLPAAPDPGTGSDPSISASLSGSFEIENQYQSAVTISFEIEGRTNPEVWANQIVLEPAQTLLISPGQSNIVSGEKWRITAFLSGVELRISNGLGFSVTNASYLLPVNNFLDITPDTYSNTNCPISGKLSITQAAVQ
jgi:hypothetical protein